MRLVYCYLCEKMSPIPEYVGRHEQDAALIDWIARHMHGLSEEAHPGARVFIYDKAQESISRDVEAYDGRIVGEMSADEMEAVQAARSELKKIGRDIEEYRHDLRIDATACHRKHGQPSLPGKPCIDYKSTSKLIGRKDLPAEARMYTCLFCPYESSVTVEKRARRGDYRADAGLRIRRRR